MKHELGQPVVVVRNVEKRFGELVVLRDVSLTVAKGETICVIGPSGSGKSTLLRCINALVPVTQGSITVDGIEVNEPKLDKLALRKKVGMVFQQYNLFPHRTALQNVMMAPVHVLKQDRAEVEARARRLLDKVRLKDKADAYPGELSGGQQQRVAIARALAMSPKVLLFDEATSALDPELRREVLSVMRQLAREGMTMLVVTHEMGFARHVGTRTVFMDRGEIVEAAPGAAFFDAPQTERAKRFLQQFEEE
jgi:polar amino acid transport system ATP-binding protein